MKKVIVLLALLCMAGVTQGQLASMYIATPPKADGKSAEWPHPFGFYNSETKLMFAIANDETNLYLCFETIDETAQMKIMKAGMKVNIVTKGKGKHNASIEFPLPLDKKGQPAPAPNETRPDMMKIRSTFLLNQQQMKLSGFATKTGVLPIKDSLGLSAFINWDGNKMIYEIKIPLSELYGAGFTPADLMNELSLAVDVKAMERPGFSPGGAAGSPANAGSGMGGGSVTQPAGGMGGVGSPGGIGTPGYPGSGNGSGRPSGYPTNDDGSFQQQSGNSVLYLKTNFKEKFTLAKKP